MNTSFLIRFAATITILFLARTTADAQVTAIAELENGAILVASGEGLFRISSAGVMEPASYEGISGSIVALASSAGEDVWIATDQALLHCLRQSCKPVSSGQDAPIQALAVGAQKTLWIGTRSGLLSMQEAAATRSPFASNMVNAIAFDAQKALWFASGFEIVKVQNAKSETFSLPPPPANVRMRPPVTSIAVTKSGTVYVGTHGGLLLLQRTSFTKKSEDEIRALLADSRDRLWVGTSKGLKKYENGRWENVAMGD